ncbi:chondroitin sulfate proteoglycan 4 isoform X1 [Triplophysa dalaica]|uniref:chondroitin sulfate proteoglycan 4 isoform X1 n=2 Tax=Triplophysa dalaica TaxID=1582913 RepID=UPI0024DF6737|nr:chondroitin sulfate proteoglycan 4 isoform X1 [Triplophysa dalaica]
MRALCPLQSALLPLLSLLYLLQTAHGASYFGDSYCRIDAIQDLSSFQVSLQFKTSRRSGLLLLAAGQRDYLSLELYNGRLQARIDMGSGEHILTSSTGLQLNNVLDHHVSLVLRDSKLTMAVDSLYTTFIPMDGEDEDLNIDQGVFLGGVKDLEVEYQSTAVPSLRGCMSNVKFESHDFDILDSAATICYDTKETCSSEFEAGDGETTSFISPESFISFPTWTRSSSNSRILEMLMKTTIEDALLAFHPGQQADFIAIGMMQGLLKGVIDLGSGMHVLENTKVKVDDDQWHRVRIQIDPNEFQINVDSEVVSLPLNGSDKLDLVGNLYLGGIQKKMKEVFQDDYLILVEEELTTESFIGCLGEIKVNQKHRSLQDALITKDIHVKCEGDYDYSAYDDMETTTTLPVRVTYVDVSLDERHCLPTKDLPEMFHNVSKLLEVIPLLVPEGGEALFDIVNLNPTFNLEAAGVRQSQIIFSLVNDPWYGLLDMNINTRRTKKFTLLDVVNKKIKYLHDGNEKYNDQILLEVIAHGTSLPECLSVAHQYILPVEILPVNDIPQIIMGDISVTANGGTRLSPNLIRISHSDNRCDNIKITVTSAPTPAGYLERANQPGVSLKEFTCRQLKEGNIYYIHKGGAVAELSLKVSDGDSISYSSTFKLLITQPQMNLVTNAGLLLTQHSTASIGIQHLAISATPKTGDIVYYVTQSLRYGELQLISNNEVQEMVMQFHQSDLEQNRLRYVPNTMADLTNAQTELIHFKAQLGQAILHNNTFSIKIIPTHVKMVKVGPLQVDRGNPKVIGLEELQAVGRVANNIDPRITYTVQKRPAKGVLFFHGKELYEGESFTQQDIMNRQISYRPILGFLTSPSYVEDQFQFSVFIDNHPSSSYTFPIKIQTGFDAPVLTNERLVVFEGNENILNKEYLWVQTSNSTDFVYKIAQDPKHGRLIRDSPPGVQRFEGAIQVFSNEDLLLNRLIYTHDGSESSHDQFTFLVFDARDGNDWQEEGNEELRGVFHIAIHSRNDHVPQRVIHKPFNVVRNGQRLLTTDDILFKDDDYDFNDTQLVYVRVGILSGNIVSSADPTQPLYRFTQADLRDGKVLFIHHGADREQFQLQVSDGYHKTTSMLQVQAGDSFLRITNISMVVMDHGSTKTLNTSMISAESNMDIRSPAEIIYVVTSAPTDGRIIVSGVESSTFTQEDLKKCVVSYENNYQSLSSKDSFAFTVQAKGLSTEGTFKIKIFKKGYLSEPEVLANQLIIAYEGEHSVIDQDHLKVEQTDILPKEMVFSVKEFPRLGHVVKLINDSKILDYIQSFTQEDINMGRIVYVSTSLQGKDHFAADVSNGFTTVENVEVQVEIVPRLIPVQVVNLTVREGGSVALTQEVLNITHPFYRQLSVDFIMEEEPQHGDIRYVEDEDGVVSFTWAEVQQGRVFYFHDSSETTEDSLTLMASAFDITRQSLSLFIGITVKPVNDEAPIIQLNTGLELQVGEKSEITSSMLSTEDEDTPPKELLYAIEEPINGIVVLKASPDDSVDAFTQAQIDNGEVFFNHQGSASGGFSFTVTDGEHTSPLHRFVVMARQLNITMETQGELMIFPGTRQVIGGDILRATTSEDRDEITYSLVKPPRLGRIIRPNQIGQFEEISKFTQTEVDAGAVYYEHQMPSEPFWVLRDSVELALSSPPATELQHSLPVTVSYYAAHRNVSSQLWKNKGESVVQGQSKVIDRSVLDASNLLASLPEKKRAGQDIVYEVRQFPVHGRLMLGGSDLPRNAPHFLQDDVTRGDLKYHHDDSGASSDSFSFCVRLNPSGRTPQAQPGSLVLEEIFRIAIRRRDSNPPEVVILDGLLEVLEGSTTIISKEYLNTVDQDNTPDEVRFTVSKSPANGYLIDTDTGEQIKQFSQDDVNMGRVAFVSDGSLSEGFIEFTVSDGKYQTGPYTLQIGVMGRTLVLNKAPEIHVRQGDDETLITEDMLSASTGGIVDEDVIYKITNAPKYAAVMVDREPTSGFTQKQIKGGRVSVRFVKSTSPRDSVAFVARSRAANVSSTLNITVKPLAKMAQNPLLPQGTTVLMDKKLLDATLLANKTRSSPTFSVIQQPRGARFIKRGGTEDGQPVSTFTQRDLDDGQVALEILNTTAGQGQDEARFLLKAHGVPPAECVLPFHTTPYDPSSTYAATLLKVPPPVSEGSPIPRLRDGATAATPVVSRMNTLWAILIPILIVLLLMLIAALLVYYLIRRNKTGKHDVQTVAAKPKNGEMSQETFRKTDPANTIPMSNMDSKGTDPELIQHCRTTNPPLKKNQYWV